MHAFVCNWFRRNFAELCYLVDKMNNVTLKLQSLVAFIKIFELISLATNANESGFLWEWLMTITGLNIWFSQLLDFPIQWIGLKISQRLTENIIASFSVRATWIDFQSATPCWFLLLLTVKRNDAAKNGIIVNSQTCIYSLYYHWGFAWKHSLQICFHELLVMSVQSHKYTCMRYRNKNKFISSHLLSSVLWKPPLSVCVFFLLNFTLFLQKLNVHVSRFFMMIKMSKRKFIGHL